MNKKLNKRIIVAGVVALLFIWVCLAFNNFDWAVLYAWILIGGGIMVVVAANIVVLAAKNGENDMFEPKISKQELMDLYRENQPVVRVEDLCEVVGKKKFVYSAEDVPQVLEKMGYTVDAVEDGFVFFKDSENKYRLFTQWIHTFQTNYLQLYTTYNVEQGELDLFKRLAAEINDRMRMVKMFVSEDESGNSLCIAVETFYSGADLLQDVLIPLIDFEERARDRFVVLRNQAKEEVKDINDIDQQVALHNNRAKYEC